MGVSLRITDVPKFKEMNSKTNVLFYENRNPSQLYNKPHRNHKHHVNLLLIMDEKSGTSPYFLIRNISRLVGGHTNHKAATHVYHVYPYCLYCFSREDFLTSQIPECSNPPPQRLKHPSSKHDGDTEHKHLEVQKPLPKLCLFQWYYIATLKHFSSQWKTIERHQRQ